MADTRTLELFKGGKGDSMVDSGGALRRTCDKIYIGALTVNPDCSIRKKEAHKQRVVENVLLKGKLDDNTAHDRMLMVEVQSLKGVWASMAVLLSGVSDSRDLTLQEYQDKFKQMAALFTTRSQIHRRPMARP